MEKEYIHGRMEKFMMENGNKDSSMVMESGKVCMEILTLENGEDQKLRVMEFTIGKMEIGMKVNGNNA